MINPDGPRAGGAKALRTLRALRLVKLLRLVRASRMFQRVKERISLSHTTMTVMRLVALTALLAHGFACVLAISTTFADSPLDTWLATFGYCRPGGTGSAAFDADGERTVVCVPEAYRCARSATIHRCPQMSHTGRAPPSPSPRLSPVAPLAAIAAFALCASARLLAWHSLALVHMPSAHPHI